MSSSFWGGFGSGFAQTFDPVVVGRGLGEAVADYREGKAIKAAEQKKAEAIKKLDTEKALQNSQAEAIKNPSAGSMEPQAIPVQGAQSDLDVDAVSSAAINPADAQRSEPMRQTTYDSRMAEINNAFENEKAQARADYYRFRGMTKEQEEAEKKLKNMQFAQKFGMFHRRAVDGDKEALGQVVRYANSTLGDGTELKVGDGGNLSLWQNGKLVQENFVPTRAQIDQMAMSMYNNARFFGDGDFDAYLGRTNTIQNMDLANKKNAREDATLAETKRHNLSTEASERQKQAITMRGQDMVASTADKDRRTKEAIAASTIEATRRGQTLTHVKDMSELEFKRTKWNAEQEAEAKKNGLAWGYNKETAEEELRGKNGEVFGTKQQGIFVPSGMTLEGVLANRAFAKKNGITYRTEYFDDPIVGGKRAVNAFRVGDYYATTLEEAKQLIDEQRAARVNANTAGAQVKPAKVEEPAAKADAQPRKNNVGAKTAEQIAAGKVADWNRRYEKNKGAAMAALRSAEPREDY